MRDTMDYSYRRPLLRDQKMYRIFLLLFCMAVSPSYADAIYKYVDENGNVSYSETPPANNENVESLEPAPDLSEDELRAARERHQKLQAYIDEAEAERARREAANQDNNWGTPPNNTLPNLPPLAGQ